MYSKKDTQIYQLDGREDKVQPAMDYADNWLAHVSMSISLFKAFSGP